MNERRILIVDDNPVNLKLAASVLEFAGCQVLEAGDATQALAVIRQTPPDLILMDIALPGMDGLTLTRQLKADQSTRHIGVVALTAFAMRGDDQKAKAAGCDGYITKPIDTRKLPGQVAEILGRLDGTREGIIPTTANLETPTERHA
jgi:CheY-like chemotaxis protein